MSANSQGATKSNIQQGDLTNAIVVKSKDGSVVKQIKTVTTLSAEDGELVKLMSENINKGKNLPAKWVPVFIKTAKAYIKQAGRCGVVLEHPDTVIVNDRQQPNGYQDQETGKIYFRSRAGGFTDLGTPYITDRTIIYDVKLYNLQDLLAKAEKNPTVFKILPREAALPGDSWAKYELDEATFLWVDCSSPEFFKWQKEMVNRRKNAERTAQTFADRNALAAHPAIPQKSKFNTAQVTQTCTCWYAESGGMRWDGSSMNIDLSKILESAPVDSQVIDINATSEEAAVVDAETAAGALEPDDARPENDDEPPYDGEEGASGEEQKDKPKESGSPADPQKDELITNIKRLANFKRVTYKKTLISLGHDQKVDLETLQVPVLVDLYNVLKSAE